MKNLFAGNLKYLRKAKGLTQDQLADKIGVNRAMIGSYEEGRALPKVSSIQDIAYYFDVTLDSLIGSELSQKKNGQEELQNAIQSGAHLRVLSTIVDRNNNEMITLVPVKASAGYLNGYADPDYVETLPRFTLPFQELTKERTYRAFQINGNSMDPIPSGAYIITEYVQDWHHIKDGKPYVLVTRDEGIVYKRVFLHPSGELWLKSDNPQYETYSIHLGRILEVWKAVGYICASLPEPDAVSLSKLSMMVGEMKQELNQLKSNSK